ncbi:MAG: response regulator [Akkermansiaceae bacterium]|nr:response regulator [Verrucomicrobiales bacterium]
MNILIVDDLATNRKLLHVTLEAEGHLALEANDGVEALEILARETVDAVISDVLMPNMDGFRLCHEIRKSERFQALPFIIYTSTYTSSDDMTLALTVGADRYLTKPAPTGAVLQALREVMEKKAARPVALAPAAEESYVLQRYSQALVHKLEEKNAQLAHANRALQNSNEELQQFVYIASHDLQTPLRNISGFVQLLQSNYAQVLDEQANDWIRRTVQSVELMHILIRDVLAFSQVDSQSVPFQPTSFREVFDDAVARLGASIRDAGGQITCDELPTVTGDRPQLVQLMENLIGNGLKYHGSEPPRVHVSVEPGGNEWSFSVRDNGIGIAPKHHERIFEIFRRLHQGQEYPGTGIGLSICRRVVQRHGGRIWVESEAGRGSVFHFTIPERTMNPP